MQSSAIVLYASRKNSRNIILFNELYGKIEVINTSNTPYLFSGALIECYVHKQGSKRYLQESSLSLSSLPTTYTDLIFVHSLLELIHYTHLYENACVDSFEVIKASLLSMHTSLCVTHKIKVLAKLFVLAGIVNDEVYIANNITDYLIYTPTKDILRETVNDIDCVILTQWIWSCLAAHPHKEKLHVVFQQLHLFKESYSS